MCCFIDADNSSCAHVPNLLNIIRAETVNLPYFCSGGWSFNSYYYYYYYLSELWYVTLFEWQSASSFEMWCQFLFFFLKTVANRSFCSTVDNRAALMWKLWWGSRRGTRPIGFKPGERPPQQDGSGEERQHRGLVQPVKVWQCSDNLITKLALHRTKNKKIKMGKNRTGNLRGGGLHLCDTICHIRFC